MMPYNLISPLDATAPWHFLFEPPCHLELVSLRAQKGMEKFRIIEAAR